MKKDGEKRGRLALEFYLPIDCKRLFSYIVR